MEYKERDVHIDASKIIIKKDWVIYYHQVEILLLWHLSQVEHHIKRLKKFIDITMQNFKWSMPNVDV